MSRISCRECGASRSNTVVFPDGSSSVYECQGCGDPTYIEPPDQDDHND